MDVNVQAEDAWRALLAEFIAPEPADMSHVPGGRSGYNVETDS
jgi:hypothetical protein